MPPLVTIHIQVATHFSLTRYESTPDIPSTERKKSDPLGIEPGSAGATTSILPKYLTTTMTTTQKCKMLYTY